MALGPATCHTTPLRRGLQLRVLGSAELVRHHGPAWHPVENHTFFSTSIVFICLQLHDTPKLFSDFLLRCDFLIMFVEVEELGRKQSNPQCVEQHITVATHLSHLFIHIKDTDGTL